MIRTRTIQAIVYTLCLYDLYLYLPDLLDLVEINVDLPTSDYLLYFDAAMLLFGGGIIGTVLLKIGSKKLGWLMIVLNVILTPLFIWKALP
ncbi:hypothetical protein [Mucilaginibacter glaciei]|uniref:Uncharacterized protein n=1 Tax=Mucilaginibacter glaciei TaxID=2772109 RepID=A0A926NV89_9SPHI|nr:hypothetical protein [Mucilaginibacter glaciei]MBD1392413.1 hypothetical protein [Mucilaginibacter glaciei]